MNELIKNAVFIANGKVFASSDKVAEYFEKDHKNVLRSIQRLIKEDVRCRLIFEPTSIDVCMPNGGIRKETVYNMTRDGFFFLTMGFTGKKANAFKHDFIDAFNKMERVLLDQMTNGRGLPDPQAWYKLKPHLTISDLPRLMDEMAKLDNWRDEREYVRDAINRIKYEDAGKRLLPADVETELNRMQQDHPYAFRTVRAIESNHSELPE